ncbi:MAG: dihydroxy-acid dehydratase [Alphaproteobacteria bacterium]|nr:dihydroxy-acid dehydratase [Alphaproteobacteria bacterium]
MDSALTMNSLAEALECAYIAYRTEQQIVDMVWEDLTPVENSHQRRLSQRHRHILHSVARPTPPAHQSIARYTGITLNMADWQNISQSVPQLVNYQPRSEFLAKNFPRWWCTYSTNRVSCG